MPVSFASSYDAIVVGTGPGGASVARTLAQAGARVLVLERGGAAPLTGTLTQMAAMAAVPGKGAFFHRDASLLVRGVTAGGSSTINFATAASPPAALFARHGIDLAEDERALRAELPLGPLPDELVGPMAARIMQGARDAGLPWRKLDKMIRPQSCRAGCWRCMYGCPFGAKWTARDFLEEACRAGAQLVADARVDKVIVAGGRAAGVDVMHGGAVHSVRASVVVLAAGGIGTPRLLHASGLAPERVPLFTDPVIAVMGEVEDIDGGAEVPMAAGCALPEEGITFADLTLPGPMYQAFAAQVGRVDRLLAHRRTLSIMVKIADETGGAVGPRWVDKTLTATDRARFGRGVGIARDILRHAGATRVFSSWHFAAHPGGTAAIGAVLDADMGTATPGLYVCDAAALPGPWGLPPTLTLLCLGRRLGRHLAGAAVSAARPAA